MFELSAGTGGGCEIPRSEVVSVVGLSRTGLTVVGVESTKRIVSECKGANVSGKLASGKRAPLVWPPRIETLDCFAKLLK